MNQKLLQVMLSVIIIITTTSFKEFVASDLKFDLPIFYDVKFQVFTAAIMKRTVLGHCAV